MRRTVLLAMALTTLAPVAAAAQAGPGPRRMVPRAAERPEDLLRLRAHLELTRDQVTRLQAMREEALAARIAVTTEMMRLRSRLHAGEVTREEVRRQMESRRDSMRTRLQDPERARARDVLTDAQREKLSEFRRELVRERGRLEMRARREAMTRDRLRDLRRRPWRN